MRNAVLFLMMGFVCFMSATHAAQAQKYLSGDVNKDGLLSKSEFLKLQEARFDRIDANHDGNVTMQEKEVDDQNKKARAMAKKEKAEVKDDKKSGLLDRFFN